MTGERSDWIDLGDSFEFPSVSWAGRLRCLPGKAAVVMALPRTVASGLALPDEVGGRLRPDVGVVASVGQGVDLVVGDLVAVDPYAGKWISDGSGGLVRMIGDETARAEVPELVPWSEQVLMRVAEPAPCALFGRASPQFRAGGG